MRCFHLDNCGALYFAVILGLTLGGESSAVSETTVRLEVKAGGHDRIHCPVVVDVPEQLREMTHFALTQESDRTAVAVQQFRERDKPKLAWMIDHLAAGEDRIYVLKGASAAGVSGPAQDDSNVQCEDDGRHISVTVGGAHVLRFNHGIVEPPDGADPIYRRSGYIHPVFTPQGNVVTGDFEPDHRHQHGIFSAWVDASYGDRPVDFWNQAKGTGDVEFLEMQGPPVNGTVFGQIRARLAYVVVSDGRRTPVLQDTWTIRVYNSGNPFLFELISEQHATTQQEVVVNEYHYGGFAARGPSAWLITQDAGSATVSNQDPPAVADFLTSSDRTRIDGNHSRARWVEMHGPIGQQHAGLIMIGGQANFRAPQPVRLHPSKPYFCFAPMVLGEFKIGQAESYRSHFRFVVHDGEPDSQLAERTWQDMAHPPVTRILD